jgi:hypothetical protein
MLSDVNLVVDVEKWRIGACSQPANVAEPDVKVNLAFIIDPPLLISLFI